MLERLLLLWLTLLSVLAYFWPTWLSADWDPFVASAPGLNYLFAVTMLAIGSLLPRDEVQQVIQRWRTVLGGTAIQYTAMPILAYGFARLFGLEGAALVGVLMAGCVPGAMASNVLTLVARGNVSYSVSLTTSATLLSPIMVPLALLLALGYEAKDFPTGKLIWDLCWMVVLPVVIGHFLSRTFVVWEVTARRVGTIIANLTILWIVAVVVATNRDKLSGLELRLPLALLGLNICGYVAGTLGSFLLRLPAPMRRALTLEVGMQNAGLGTVLARNLFGDTAAIAPALYTFGCMFTGTILARCWAEFGRKEGKETEGVPEEV